MFQGPRRLRYFESKLANGAFTAALHHRLHGRGSKDHALVAHPGYANTSLQQTSVKDGGMGRMLTDVISRFSQSADDRAMGIRSCMCLPEAAIGRSFELWAPGWPPAAPA